MGKLTKDDQAHDRAMTDAAIINRLEKENAQLREMLKTADQAGLALAALLDMAMVKELKIGQWYVYRCATGTADAMKRDDLDPEPDGRVKSVAYALHRVAIREYNHTINRAVNRLQKEG